MTSEQRRTGRCFAVVVGLLMLAHGVHVGWVLFVVALMLAVDKAGAEA